MENEVYLIGSYERSEQPLDLPSETMLAKSISDNNSRFQVSLEYTNANLTDCRRSGLFEILSAIVVAASVTDNPLHQTECNQDAENSTP